MSDTWRCPGCWERWPCEIECPNCGSNHPSLYRHPPVDPKTGGISADDDAILMGDMQHCAVPRPYRNNDCAEVMNDHGWIDDGSKLGITVCPPLEHADA